MAFIETGTLIDSGFEGRSEHQSLDDAIWTDSGTPTNAEYDHERVKFGSMAMWIKGPNSAAAAGASTPIVLTGDGAEYRFWTYVDTANENRYISDSGSVFEMRFTTTGDISIYTKRTATGYTANTYNIVGTYGAEAWRQWRIVLNFTNDTYTLSYRADLGTSWTQCKVSGASDYNIPMREATDRTTTANFLVRGYNNSDIWIDDIRYSNSGITEYGTGTINSGATGRATIVGSINSGAFGQATKYGTINSGGVGAEVKSGTVNAGGVGAETKSETVNAGAIGFANQSGAVNSGGIGNGVQSGTVNSGGIGNGSQSGTVNSGGIGYISQSDTITGNAIGLATKSGSINAGGYGAQEGSQFGSIDSGAIGQAIKIGSIDSGGSGYESQSDSVNVGAVGYISQIDSINSGAIGRGPQTGLIDAGGFGTQEGAQFGTIESGALGWATQNGSIDSGSYGSQSLSDSIQSGSIGYATENAVINSGAIGLATHIGQVDSGAIGLASQSVLVDVGGYGAEVSSDIIDSGGVGVVPSTDIGSINVGGRGRVIAGVSTSKSKTYPTKEAAHQAMLVARKAWIKLFEYDDDWDISNISTNLDETNKQYVMSRPDRQSGTQIVYYKWL
jgi:hypothetical protein